MNQDNRQRRELSSVQQRLAALDNLNLRALFVASFFLGLIPITATASTNRLWVVVVFGVVLPLFFLVAYFAVGKFTYQALEQREQFADSVYYLGFLLTLASLFAALFSLKGETPHLGMLAARFGLALGTTIIGLLIRVAIVNFERDIDDEERRARESLSEGVDQFQAEVERLSDQLELVLGGIAQSARELGQQTIDLTKEQLDELRRQSEDTHKEFTASNAALLGESSRKFNDAVSMMHNSLLTTLNEANSSIKAAAHGTAVVFEALQETPKAYQKRTEQNIQALEASQNSLGDILAAQQKMVETLHEQSRTAGEISQRLNESGASTASQLEKFVSAGNKADEATRRIADCLSNLDELGRSLQRFDSAVKRGPVELEVMLPKLRLAMNEITQLSESGEKSLRQVQQNLIDSSEAIIRHLGTK